jgi:predicted acetyltransferase
MALSMKIEVSPASIDDKSLFQRMMELYQYDLSEFENNDLDSHACFGYSYLDHYWEEKDRHPFIVRVDGKLAGFVLVNKHTYLPGNEWSIAEFFIMRKYRRQGIGKAVAFYIFDQFRGKWEVQEMEANLPAQRCWRKVIAEYTGGHYLEANLNNELWKGPIQYFDNTQ